MLEWIHFFFITCTLIQHLALNRMNKQDSTPLGTRWLTDRQTQIIHSSQPLQAVQLCRVLTDTSQQQLYPKQNRENNHESDASWFVTIFCLCRSAIAAHSGCSSILLPQLNSCPLIYTPNLATIKIPWLLVNSLSRSCSTSHPWFVSSDNSAMWCRCLVNPSKYVWREHWLCLMWAQRAGVWAKKQRLIEVQLTSAKHVTGSQWKQETLGWMQPSEPLNKSHACEGLIN